MDDDKKLMAEDPKKTYIRKDVPLSRPSVFPSPVKNVQDTVIPSFGQHKVDIGDAAASVNGNKLVIGRDITLNGDISICDNLLIEGKVSASLGDCKNLEVAHMGELRGTISVTNATINGLFEGELTVKEKLVVREHGVVRGKVFYGQLEVVRGGIIFGTMEALSETTTSATPKAKKT